MSLGNFKTIVETADKMLTATRAREFTESVRGVLASTPKRMRRRASELLRLGHLLSLQSLSATASSRRSVPCGAGLSAVRVLDSPSAAPHPSTPPTPTPLPLPSPPPPPQPQPQPQPPPLLSRCQIQ